MNIVIGAGISGLTVGQGLDGELLVLEKNAVAGGLSGQYLAKGFAFDYGGHYFHFQNKPEIKVYVEKFHDFRVHRRNSKIFILNRFIPYSLQYHLAYLPAPLRKAILAEIDGSQGESQENLEKFLLANFGSHFYRLFFKPYLLKFYNRPLTGMLAGMDKGSIPVPRLEEVLAGFRGRKNSAEGYNPVFYYPRQALQKFIQDYGRPLQDKISFSETVLHIDARQRKVVTNGGTYHYDNLISTMPLKELLAIISPVPPFPRQQLQNISTLVANAVLARRRRRFHWLYLPEKRFPFYRVGYYPGQGVISVYLEKTIAAAETIDGPGVFREMAFTLRRTGMVARQSEILFHDLKRIPVSYVVFNPSWPRLVPDIHSYLRRQGIHSIGRYGSWHYSSMADDIKMALATARQINENGHR
jgi:protoporphyrinogen oxidase